MIRIKISMETCLICHKEINSKSGLGIHVRKSHGLTSVQYKTKFNLHVVCAKCGKIISKRGTKSDYCNHCRDRSGEHNPFFGKKHTAETIGVIKEKTARASKTLWKNDIYRQSVIGGTTGLKRDDSFKATQKANALQQYQDITQHDIRSATMKQTWADGKITVQRKGATSKIEKEFFAEMCKISPYSVSKHSLHLDGKMFFPDVIVSDRIIFEFYGTYWHADPRKYCASDIVAHGQTAQQIWNRDIQRQNVLELHGYTVVIIWEYDYCKDKKVILSSIDNSLNWDDTFLG